MTLAIIVAMSQNRVIGLKQTIPWQLPHDLQHFKALTLGHPILMGRKTHASIGRVLPGRQNIVISRDSEYTSPGCFIAHSLDEALRVVADSPLIFVIGGAELYKEALPFADRIYLTLIETTLEGDTFFPELSHDWREQSNEHFTRDAENAYDHRFITYVR